jgi:O-antigen/teichoic acid export membrane protein
VLIGYSIGSWIALLFCWKTNKSSTFIAIFNVYQKGKQDGFTKALRDYAFPLRMNPLLGWLTGQGDRYIIGAFGGLHGVGIYSSLYSIVSRPFLMLSSIVELWFRQQFYTKVSVGDFRGAKKIFTLWISGVVASALALVFVLTALDSWVSNLILDARFQGYSHVMVWIGVGYVFHVAYLVVERVFYAFGNTKMVLKMQILGACLSALIPLLMVLKFGWVGAAWSVPFYFGIQLVVSIGVAKIKYGFLLRSADK